LWFRIGLERTFPEPAGVVIRFSPGLVAWDAALMLRCVRR
jgi:hypothetical protein